MSKSSIKIANKKDIKDIDVEKDIDKAIRDFKRSGLITGMHPKLDASAKDHGKPISCSTNPPKKGKKK